MARRTKRQKASRASNRKLANLLAAPRPEPSAREIVEASKKGNAIELWFTYGDVIA